MRLPTRFACGVLVGVCLCVAPLGRATSAGNMLGSQPPYCPAADIGPAPPPSAQAEAPEGSPPQVPTAGSITRHVGELRGALNQTSVELLARSAELLRRPAEPVPSMLLQSGEAASYVASLQAELRDAVTSRLGSPLGSHVELAVRSAVVDVVLERINAYERVYGVGTGQGTTFLNTLTPDQLQVATASLSSAREDLAMEIARRPGTPDVDLQRRWIELDALKMQVDAEVVLRRVQGQPRLVAIVTADTRAQALARHPSIVAVDADDVRGRRSAQALRLHIELRASARPGDASLAMFRSVVARIEKVGAGDVNDVLFGSFRGREPRPPKSTGPNPPSNRPPGGSSADIGLPPPRGPPLSGGGADTTDAVEPLRRAIFEEAEAVRTRAPASIAKARGRLAAEVAVLRAALRPDVVFEGMELAALSDTELTTMRARHAEWLGHLASEDAAGRGRVAIRLEMEAARVRISQIKSVLAMRAGVGWRGALGAAAPAQAPPTRPEQLHAWVRAANADPTVLVQRALSDSVAARTESAALAGWIGDSRTPDTSGIAQAVAEARARELTADQLVLQRSISSLDAVGRAVIGAPGVGDVDGRRRFVAAQAAMSRALRAHNAEVEVFKRTAPAEAAGLRILQIPTALNGSGHPDMAHVSSLLRDGLIALESARKGVESPLLSPVAIANESEHGMVRARRIPLAGAGVPALSESMDFGKLFPATESWTRNKYELRRAVSRLPGGVIFQAELPAAVARELTDVRLDLATGELVIALRGRLLRTAIKMTPGEFRQAWAFASDGRLVAVDIRGMKRSDIEWTLENALPFPLTELTPSEQIALKGDIEGLSSVNVHPELEHGPWADALIDADQTIFNVLPHSQVLTSGDLQFKGLDVRPLREAFHRDEQVLFGSSGRGGRSIRKSVLAFDGASLHCIGDRVHVQVGLLYDVYQSERRMVTTSAWLTDHDAQIRQRVPSLMSAARFAAGQVLLRATMRVQLQSAQPEVLMRPPEYRLTPKFLCSGTRQTADECQLKILGRHRSP